MALSDSLITAAAGLVGAGIGGLSTYVANRGQWRRESRRTVYANLIGAAYKMESLIESKLKLAVVTSMDTSPDTDLPTQFALQLDSAALLAKGNTQEALDGWRRLYVESDQLAKTSPELLKQVQDCRKLFYEYARDELGAPGMVRSRRRAVWCCIAAVIPFLYFPAALRSSRDLQADLPGYSAFIKNTGIAFWGVTSALLFIAFLAALNWRAKLIDLNQPIKDRKAVEKLLIAIVVAIALSIAAFFLNGDTASLVFTILGDMIVVGGVVWATWTAKGVLGN
jgi:uncharacterized membrane protein YwzB